VSPAEAWPRGKPPRGGTILHNTRKIPASQNPKPFLVHSAKNTFIFKNKFFLCTKGVCGLIIFQRIEETTGLTTMLKIFH